MTFSRRRMVFRSFLLCPTLLLAAGLPTIPKPKMPKMPTLIKPSPVNGTWTGQMNKLPAIKLVVEDKGGKTAGNVTFYLQTKSEDGQWHADEKGAKELPLLAPKLKKTKFTFEVWHNKVHGGDDYGPNKKFRLTLTEPDRGVLEEVGVKDPLPPLTLLRQPAAAQDAQRK